VAIVRDGMQQIGADVDGGVVVAVPAQAASAFNAVAAADAPRGEATHSAIAALNLARALPISLGGAETARARLAGAILRHQHSVFFVLLC